VNICTKYKLKPNERNLLPLHTPANLVPSCKEINCTKVQVLGYQPRCKLQKANQKADSWC
jgi:hypothetical protein